MPSQKVTIPGRNLVSYPVLRTIYRLIFLSSIFARLPFWIVGLLFRRQHPRWTFKQAFMCKLIRAMVYMDSCSENPVPLSLKPGKEKSRFETYAPFPSEAYAGKLAGSKAAVPVTIGGTWYPEKPADMTKVSSVVMHIHGGAFVIDDGRTEASGYTSNVYLEHGKVGVVFCPQYRLSSRPTNAPFPAAGQDVLTSYLHLVRTLGVAPEKITVSGDSAGGNLVIMLLRYIAEHGSELGIPAPRSAILVSPWVSPIKSLWPDITITSNPNYNSDFLGVEFCRWGIKTYAKVVDPADPYISPLGHPFATSVPIFVAIGAAEILEIDDTAWVGEMRRVEGNEVEVYYEPDAPHDTILVGDRAGWRESSQEVARRIGAFIRKHA
ncbi:alpha/beta hydrolase fold-3 domain-containing protein [Xylariaceae sp. FL0255]|nr:alpha/beta hydrolase fold-3 domain-containing protein [Xylariaceae sp. FL0255]